MNKRILFLIPALIPLIIVCSDSNRTTIAETAPAEFDAYWNQGTGEITSYRLEQARYGELNSGSAVLVFVTEPFSRSKQVKLDDPNATPDDNAPVLKLNMTKKFLTGLYPYSMMMSVFTPLDSKNDPYVPKLTVSSQEWCGHTFTQLNLDGDRYAFKTMSYFEEEGDQEFTLGRAMLEDELWTRIRLDPGSLPTGNVRLIPSLLYQRLRHTEFKAQSAKATLAKAGNTEFGAGDLSKYTIAYNNVDRTISIYFNNAFPYDIMGWEETYLSGFGPGAVKLTTKAYRDTSIQTDYWNKHNNEHRPLRKQLNLPVN